MARPPAIPLRKPAGAGSVQLAQAAALFRQGLSFHQQGQLAQAKAVYEQILSKHPRHSDALHLLGVIAFQSGSPALALELIGKAIGINPTGAAQHSNAGLALQQLGRLQEAVASYDKAIALQPDYAEAYSNRGLALQALGQLEQAIASHDKAIALQPGYAQALFNRGLALQKLGRMEDAVASYDQVIAIQPAHADAHCNRGLALRALGRLEDALASYEKAIAIQPGHADAYFNRGLALQALQRPQEAVASYGKAAALRPGHADACSNRGNALQELGRMEEAVASYDQAIAMQPGHAEAFSNRGLALHRLGRLQEAVASYDKAIALRPGYAEAHCNRGLALHALARPQEAVASYDRAIAIQPGYADAWWNKALALLLAGEFERGWELYEWRLRMHGKGATARSFAQPRWLGTEDITGKTILLHAEQGLGDSIQFSRYAALVKARGARVVLEVPGPLAGLLAGLEGVDELVQAGRGLPAFDWHCPLLSLPGVFRTGVDTIPGRHRPYLASDGGKRNAWARRLGERKRPRIGLVWSGNAAHHNDRNRSLPLAELVRALPQGFEYVSLQKDVRDGDVDALKGSAVRHFGEALADFTDTAALCDLMDIVISVDTSVAHLAGAMGKATWVLLPHVPDWRWLLGRDDSPWYATAKLYRQDASGSWAPVLQRVAQDLSA